jgi:hypothetical protein
MEDGMMYLLTEAQHAQILSAYTEDWGDIEQAVAMLKAIQPVEPVAWIIEFENGDTELHFHDANNSLGESQIPLYTPEQSK